MLRKYFDFFLPLNIIRKRKIKEAIIWLFVFKRKNLWKNFCGNAKIVKFLIQIPVRKIKFNLYKDQIYRANLKSFSNQLSDSTILSFFVYIKYIFILKILFQSSLMRHWTTQSAFEDTQTAAEHSKNSESTRALGWHLSTRGTLFKGL